MFVFMLLCRLNYLYLFDSGVCVTMLCLLLLCVCFFFFFKQKTVYDVRISDWSSDVCSSDLLDSVANLDQDRILRRYLNVIEATLRTNYFQGASEGKAKPYLSFKLDSRVIDDLPLPRPMVEIAIYSPRVEAVHLRGGKEIGRAHV